MTSLPYPGAGTRNPANDEEAHALVKYVESLFMPWNVDALVEGFVEDCIVRFCDIPEFSGHRALREFFVARSKRQKDYKLSKTMRLYADSKICGIGHGTWIDVATGQSMHGFGVEIWHMRDGKIAIWEGAFNAAPVGGTSSSSPLPNWVAS